MNDKNIQIRNCILELIESDQVKAGERLPGARKIAEKLHMSFTHVQAVVESLVQCGILNAVSRSGTYVSEDWPERLLPYNFFCYAGDRIKALTDIVNPVCTANGLRLCRQFEQGVAEIRVSHYLLSHHNEYLDLSEIFRECFGDGKDFYMQVLKDFYINGRLSGLPIVFSPRVILYNVDVFKRCKCPIPRKDWTWDEFLDTIRYLKKYLPADSIFNWESQIQSFTTFFVRAGGTLFDSANGFRPSFDDAVGLKAFEHYIELRDMLDLSCQSDSYCEKFSNNEAAMLFGVRQIMCQLNKFNPNYRACAVKLPLFPDGRDINIHGADLLCFRKSCTNMDLVRKLVKSIFSEKIQDMVAGSHYGIPFRKTSAAKGLDPKSCYDSVFMEEIPKISAAYNIFTPEIYRMIRIGFARICSMPKGEIAGEVRDLAKAINMVMTLNEFEEEKSPI